MADDRSSIDVDLAALHDYLRGLLGGYEQALKVERVGGGQSNPTYFVDYGQHRLVLRRKPSGNILPGAHAVEREFRVMKALRGTDVPVPTVLSLCEDADTLGTAFYLMERLDGRVFQDCSLPGLSASERRAIYLSVADAMARLHAVSPSSIGLGDFGRQGNYFERQISRWTRQYIESSSARIPALDDIAKWLPKHVPPDDGRISVAHGDFRLGNMLFHREKPEVIAILDWELATIGHPLADLAFFCIAWHSAPEEYGGVLGLDLPSLGIPDERVFVNRYFASANATAPLLPFHLAFALFRFAVIFYGIADRAKAGTASSANASDIGILAETFASRAKDVIASA